MILSGQVEDPRGANLLRQHDDGLQDEKMSML